MHSIAARNFTSFERRVAGAHYGVIEAVDGRVMAIRLRWFPKLLTFTESLWARRILAPWRRADRCRLYYNQPLGAGRFLALKYLVSESGASLATVNAALRALDAIAKLKQSDAILCEAWNPRLGDAVLARWGWTRHCPNRRGRHYIKRFYGAFPDTPSIDDLLGSGGHLGRLATPA